MTSPCDQGEGDCDNNAECGDGLVCGENNCQQFGQFFHPKDDCCMLQVTGQQVPIEPPAGIAL